MALRTDYQNFIPDENGRRYIITDDGSGYQTIQDVTNYLQRGTNFGANDINAITTEINKLNNYAEKTTIVTLPTTNWTSSNGYYYKDFNVTGMTESYIGSDAVDFVRPAKNSSYPSNYDMYKAMFSLITDIESYDGYIRVYMSEVPTTSIQIILYGV